MTNCENPKTKLDKILKFLRTFLKYLDNNKVEAIIFFLGIAAASIVAAISINPDNIKIILEQLTK